MLRRQRLRHTAGGPSSLPASKRQVTCVVYGSVRAEILSLAQRICMLYCQKVVSNETGSCSLALRQYFTAAPSGAGSRGYVRVSGVT